MFIFFLGHPNDFFVFWDTLLNDYAGNRSGPCELCTYQSWPDRLHVAHSHSIEQIGSMHFNTFQCISMFIHLGTSWMGMSTSWLGGCLHVTDSSHSIEQMISIYMNESGDQSWMDGHVCILRLSYCCPSLCSQFPKFKSDLCKEREGVCLFRFPEK